MGYSLKPRGSSRWVSAAIVVPLPEASQPSRTMIVGTPLSQHAFSRSYKRNCSPGTMRLYSSRESFFFRLMFSSMGEGQFYSRAANASALPDFLDRARAVCVNALVRICGGAISDGRPCRDSWQLRPGMLLSVRQLAGLAGAVRKVEFQTITANENRGTAHLHP